MGEILILTNIASPYQVELFDALAAADTCLSVAYLSRRGPGRAWTCPDLHHPCRFVDEMPGGWTEVRAQGRRAKLAVFSGYRHPGWRAMMSDRAASGKPWCFWGERPGYRRTGAVGRLYRAIALSALRRSRAPIWGMGSWAVEAYRREFGPRLYCNVPYFSDLERLAPPTRAARWPLTRFLYCGTLSRRKGVDLLAGAFAALADEFRDVTLHVVGEGPLMPRMARRLARCQDRVRFHGFHPWSDLPSVYRLGDVLCVPSRHDGWGLVVPEGLAAGLPVVASDRTGAALDLIEPNVNGWRYPAGDGSALHRAMRAARLLSREAAATMVRAARETAASHSLGSGVRRVKEAIGAVHQAWCQPSGGRFG